jgi:hypothetical protein
MYQNIYKLGHCEPLALAEFAVLSRNADYDTLDGWLTSDFEIDVNATGSLVYGGKIVGHYDAKSVKADQEELLNVLYEYIQPNAEKLKKLGISVPYELSANILNLAKKAGSKKINVLTGKKPNIGNWKGLKNWIIAEYIGGKVVVFHVTSYADQEFWSKLDTILPVSDMRRGIINLKLARSLLNLSTNTKIYDPFCGNGRVAIAGMDTKKTFWLSDLDDDCLPSVEENTKFAERYWIRKVREQKPPNFKIFQQDARDIRQSHEEFEGFSIVTEGYLGHNFSATPTTEQIKIEYEKQEKMWHDVIQSCDEKKIDEIVFCLPCYAKSSPRFIKELAESFDYRLVTFGGKDGIVYSRKDSFVGHYICKIVKV